MPLVTGGRLDYDLNTECVPCGLKAYAPDVNALWEGNSEKHGLEEAGASLKVHQVPSLLTLSLSASYLWRDEDAPLPPASAAIEFFPGANNHRLNL